MGLRRSSLASDVDVPEAKNKLEHTFGESISNRRLSDRSRSSIQSSKILDVEELEMILEAYFVQIEGTLNKLSAVCVTYNSIFSFMVSLYSLG